MSRKNPPAKAVEEARTREAKGSVHEAIGKLIGDDIEVIKGRAEKHAGAESREDAEDTRDAKDGPSTRDDRAGD